MLIPSQFRKRCLKAATGYTGMLVLLLVPVNGAYAQTWEKQNSGVTTNVYDVCFPDTLHGWAVGDSGTILATTDGGSSWQRQVSGVNVLLSKVDFVDSLFGWTVGHQGTVLRTADGGHNWAKETAELWNYQDVCFVDTSVGYIVAGSQTPDGPYGTIAKTTDGGVTWDTTICRNAAVFQGADFVSRTEGWAVGGKTFIDNFDPDIIVHTTDGGATWIEQSTPTDGPLYRVKFLNSKFGCAAGFSNDGNSILTTSNGGELWTPIITPGGPQGVLSIAVLDPLTLWVVRFESVYFTLDGGGTWTRFNAASVGMTSISFVDPYHGWLVGGGGSIWKYHGKPTNVVDVPLASWGFTLQQCFPNPFNPSTTIRFSIPYRSIVRLTVYDVLGRMVTELLCEEQPAGWKEVKWDASGISSGVYIYRLEATGIDGQRFLKSNRMVLLR